MRRLLPFVFVTVLLVTPCRAESPPDQVLTLAEGPSESLPINELLHLDTGHLIALGGGILLGATVIPGYLGVSELAGLIIGLVGGEVAFRMQSVLFPRHGLLGF